MQMYKSSSYMEDPISTQHAQWTFEKIGNTFNGPLQFEKACIRSSEYILYEILD